MSETTDPDRFPLHPHLTTRTAQTGHALDPDTLDPTDPAFPTLVAAWVEAAARHAAATLRRQRAQAVADVAAGALAADGTAPLETGAPAPLPTGRSTILRAALHDVGFTAGPTTPGVPAGTYELRNAGAAIRADLAADGTVALHATDPDGTHRWDLTYGPATPLPFLTAVIGACGRTTGNHQREGATTFHPHTATPAGSMAFTQATGGVEDGRDDV
ncbi:hypothetical protein AB0M46_47465 [Dactylosporangium sp. NPDC051485]|uniref:hypothetical protein n=1 Tax=Dactylosporangium sp. NPDC051485 TaxID=3154846 RepID=UPI00341A736C